MNRWTERRRGFRRILTGDACVYPASVFDPLSARIAADIGFEATMLAGSVASMTVLGAPDLVVLTLTEFAEQCYRINRAGSLPLMVDADHGYGNALSVRRTIEELENAGVAAAMIEDTLLPTPFGAGDKVQLISREEGVGKMKAALDGRADPDFAVIARTSALSIGGLDDTLARVKAYAALGVDAIFLAGVKDKEQLEAVSRAVSIPIVMGSTSPGLGARAYLASRRVRLCLLGHQPFLASIRAVHDALKALRDGVPPADVPGVASPKLVKDATRESDYDRWTKTFLAP